MKQIPNLFTLLNLFLGCIAITLILQTGEKIVVLGEGFTDVNLPEKITWASYFIFAAAAVDFLDGFVARLFKASSEMGKQLDSLADVVSFGVAPGMILYQLLRISFARHENGLDTSIAWLLPAFIFSCAGAWRLARFNIDTTQSTSFKGVPIPAAGLVVASLPLIIWYPNPYFSLNEVLTNEWVIYGIIALLSYLMISTLPLMSMKVSGIGFAENKSRYILLIIGIVAAIFLKWLAVPVIFLAYVIVSLTFKSKTTQA